MGTLLKMLKLIVRIVGSLRGRDRYLDQEANLEERRERERGCREAPHYLVIEECCVGYLSA